MVFTEIRSGQVTSKHLLLMGLKPCRALAAILASAAADGDVIEEVVVAVQRDGRLLRRPEGAKRDETVRDGTVDVLLYR